MRFTFDNNSDYIIDSDTNISYWVERPYKNITTLLNNEAARADDLKSALEISQAENAELRKGLIEAISIADAFKERLDKLQAREIRQGITKIQSNIAKPDEILSKENAALREQREQLKSEHDFLSHENTVLRKKLDELMLEPIDFIKASELTREELYGERSILLKVIDRLVES